MQQQNSSVQVAVRVRPLLAHELADGAEKCVDVPQCGEPEIVVGGSKKFTFDHVLSESEQQESIFQKCVEPLLDGCFEGFNATIFAYGQTGSGKTHTMGTGFAALVNSENIERGTEDNCLLTPQDGVIPRVMTHLFSRASEAKAKSGDIISMSCSYLELYKENVKDLLKPSEKPLSLREDAKGTVFVAGLHEEKVSSLRDMAACLRQGATSRSTGGTKMNTQSSRSHAVFTITIERTTSKVLKTEGEDSGYRKSTLRLVDLAGSERAKRTGASGNRLCEGIAINSGLLALGNVISILGDDKKKKNTHVPYRDSKLTRLLQSSLGGNSRTLMIACISPADSNIEETVNCLRYANRARNIQNRAVQNRDIASAEVMRLRSQVQTLQRLLLKSRSKNHSNGSITNEDKNEFCALQMALEENKQLAAKLADVERMNAELLNQLRSSSNGNGNSNPTNHYRTTVMNAKMEEMQAELNLLRFKLASKTRDGHHDFDAENDASFANDESIVNQQNRADEEHSKEQDRMASELAKLTAALERKQNEVNQVSLYSKGTKTKKMNSAQIKVHQQKEDRKCHALKASMKGLEKEVATLTQQKKILSAKVERLALKQESTQKKLHNRYKQQLATLEARLSATKMKANEQKKALRQKEKAIAAASKAASELEALKRQRVQLMRRQKELATKHREEVKSRDAQMKQLVKSKRAQSHEMAKLQRQQTKNSAVLRQMTMAAAAARKRLRDAQEKQANAQRMRAKSSTSSFGSQKNSSSVNNMLQHLTRELTKEVHIAQLRPKLLAAVERRKEIMVEVTAAQGALQRADLLLGKQRTALDKAKTSSSKIANSDDEDNVSAAEEAFNEANMAKKKAVRNLNALRQQREEIQVEIGGIQTQILESSDRNTEHNGIGKEAARWKPICENQNPRHIKQVLQFLFQKLVSAQTRIVSSDYEDAAKSRALDREREMVKRERARLQQKMRNVYKLRQKRNKRRIKRSTDENTITNSSSSVKLSCVGRIERTIEKENGANRQRGARRVLRRNSKAKRKSHQKFSEKQSSSGSVNAPDEIENEDQSDSDMELWSGDDLEEDEYSDCESEYEPDTAGESCADDSDFDDGIVRRRRHSNASTRSNGGKIADRSTLVKSSMIEETETAASILERVKADAKSVTCAQLKACLRARGEKVGGKKSELIERLERLEQVAENENNVVVQEKSSLRMQMKEARMKRRAESASMKRKFGTALDANVFSLQSKRRKKLGPLNQINIDTSKQSVV
eukprot:g3224.t1